MTKAEQQKLWLEKNPDYHREYREKNIEKRRQWNREWIANNRERYNESKYAYRARVKETVISYYSNGTMRCAVCGVNDIDVLCLDHINDDGAEMRKKYRTSGRGNGAGQNTYEAVKKLGFPEGLQVLCANCNLKKEIERKRRERNGGNNITT